MGKSWCDEYPDAADWICTTPTDVLMVLLSLVVVYAAVIIYTRITGLRSFSKMSAADFAMTIAVGSLMGSAIATSKPPIALALVALGGLFGAQWIIAAVRHRSGFARKAIDNAPLLIMSGPNVLHENLSRANMTEQDLYAKLREANVWRFEQVLAVVFESTGDVSVLHSDDASSPAIESAIFQEVRGASRLP
ncbi:MAG: YetF domain-containing protein [Polyangiales bacterium]